MRHQQAFTLFRQIGTTAAKLWLDNNGVVATQGEDGVSAQLSAAEKTALRGLGYNIGPLVVELFQMDYNVVQAYRFGTDWYTSEQDIGVDDKIGPETRAAILVASLLQAGMGPWRGLIKVAEGS